MQVWLKVEPTLNPSKHLIAKPRATLFFFGATGFSSSGDLFFAIVPFSIIWILTSFSGSLSPGCMA